MFKNKMLRKILGTKRDEATKLWRKVHNEKLHKYNPHLMFQ
jgi:ATP-dependent Clp protease adapter protein ClpS